MCRLFVYNLRMLKRGLPSLSDLLFISVFAGSMLIGSRMINTDGDLGRHLTLGNLILNSQSIPTRDVLSFTRSGEPRPPYEWLSQVLFAIANRLLGLDGVVLLTSATIAVTFTIVYIDSAARSGAPLIALLVSAAAALASSLHWLTRPHVFSFLFFAVWVTALERLRIKRPVPLWLFPVIMLVWANAHGGFVFGILAWGAYLAGWAIHGRLQGSSDTYGPKLIVAGVASLAASVITPDSWHNWQALLQNRSAYVLGHTVETMSPLLLLPATWPFFALLAVWLVGTACDFRKLEVSHALLLSGLAALSLVMARNIPFFAIAAAPILSAWGARAVQRHAGWAQLESADGRD